MKVGVGQCCLGTEGKKLLGRGTKALHWHPMAPAPPRFGLAGGAVAVPGPERYREGRGRLGTLRGEQADFDLLKRFWLPLIGTAFVTKSPPTGAASPLF